MFKVGDIVRRKLEHCRGNWFYKMEELKVRAIGQSQHSDNILLYFENANGEWWASKFELVRQPKTLEQIYEET